MSHHVDESKTDLYSVLIRFMALKPLSQSALVEGRVRTRSTRGRRFGNSDE